MTTQNLSAKAIDAVHRIEQALDVIGEHGKTDHDLAKIIVDGELELRALVRDVLGPR